MMLGIFSGAFTSSILVSYGCCNILSWTCWLETTEGYSLTVMETRCLKSVLLRQNQGIHRTPAPCPLQHLKLHSLNSFAHGPFLPSIFKASGITPSLSDSASLCFHHMAFLSSMVFLCLPLIKNMWLHLGSIQIIQGNLISKPLVSLIYSHLQSPFFFFY